MPNIRQGSSQPVQPLLQSAQTLPGLPPLHQNRIQSSLLPYGQESRVLAGIPNQYAGLQQFPTQSQIQRPQFLQKHALQPRANSGYNGRLMPQNAGTHPIHPQFPSAGFQVLNFSSCSARE